ncbi:MAG TPA: metallophosphoesterase family protein [Coleofasciculaceae cyanobacterium]
MRLLAIGDIHGCSIALDTLLNAIDPQRYDKLVALGDYFNKGPDSKGTVERLITLYDQGRLIPLLGNHELKILAAKNHQVMEYGDSQVLIDQHTLGSYTEPGEKGQIENIPNYHWSFIETACLAWWEGDNVFFVHATVDPNKPLIEQPSEKLFWEKFNNPAPHVSGKMMICGHTPQQNGYPLNLGHAVCIDTWACGGQWLTGLDVQTGEIWQTNQKGQVRRSQLENFRNTEN